jgi:hypothetical protein
MGLMDNNIVLNSEKSREIINRQASMDKETIERVKAALLRQGVDLLQSYEYDEHLVKYGKEAATYSDGTMIMHTKVSASGFYEELIHYGQIKSGRAIQGDKQNELLLEIEAKERLIKYRKAYNITDYEIEVLQSVLKQYKALLNNL